MKALLAMGGLLLGLAAPDATAAGVACPPGLPAGVFCGTKDASAAVGGTYALDPSHSSIIARYFHLGYSYSIFRFGKPEGMLTWDPADLSRAKLTVSVETGSIETPVPGFAEEIASDKFLKSSTFPKATFVSTAFRRTDATHGEVDGQLTLMGKTMPLTFKVELIGAGKGFGQPRIGIEARSKIKPQDYGLPPVMTTPIDLVIDAEFAQTP